jgi:hypothetical protein
MINLEKIKIYFSYDRDIDSWARCATKNEKRKISNEDWYLLDTFSQDIILLNNKLTSVDYANELRAKLINNFDSKDTLIKFEKLLLSNG